jgi:hypothetical protein
MIGLWGLSRNIDESNLASGRRTVPANLIQFLNGYWNAPYDSDFIFGHAGLNHTYGYLFSILETPYGYKRARYVRHEIEAGFGIKEGILSGTPKQGTLLLNLTLFAGKIAFRDDPAGRDEIDRLFKSKAKTAPLDLIKFDFTKLQPKRLNEVITTEDQSIEMRTNLIPFLEANPHGNNSMLLIQLSFLPIPIRCRAEDGLGDGLGEVSLPAGGAISSIPRLAEDFNVSIFPFLILCDDVMSWY